MKWIEEHPVAWRVTLLILCFLITGYFEARESERLQQLEPVSIGEAQ